MSIWKVAKNFRHVERILNHFEHDLRKGFESRATALEGPMQHLVGIAEAADFKARDIAQQIGELVAGSIQNVIEEKMDPPLSDARVEIRTNGGTANRPEPNVWGPEKPLISSETLWNSITWGTKRTPDGVDVEIGVPDDSEAADYAALQELGGITSSSSMIPNAIVPPRPFLVPGLVDAEPKIQELMVKWVESTVVNAARVS